jgi:hypothetical protein
MTNKTLSTFLSRFGFTAGSEKTGRTRLYNKPENEFGPAFGIFTETTDDPYRTIEIVMISLSDKNKNGSVSLVNSVRLRGKAISKDCITRAMADLVQVRDAIAPVKKELLSA